MAQINKGGLASRAESQDLMVEVGSTAGSRQPKMLSYSRVWAVLAVESLLLLKGVILGTFH